MNEGIKKKPKNWRSFFKILPSIVSECFVFESMSFCDDIMRPLRAKPSRWMDTEWRAQSVSVSITLKRLLCLLFLCTGYPDNDWILTTVMFTRPPPAHLSSRFVCSAGCNYRPCSAALMPSHKSNFYICLKCCQSIEHVSTASVAADDGKRSKEGWT